MFAQSCETYDLKLDQTCIFLRDAGQNCVMGTFHINLPRCSSFKGIRVELMGVLKVPRDDYLIRNDRQLITSASEQSIGSSKKLSAFQLPAGNYEFPFSIPLSGRMLETVTSYRRMYHTYHVQAIIERRFRGNSIISRPLRIYYYPDLWADHQILTTPVAIERQSDQEIQYCISIPDSNIPFGSTFPVKCYFSPLSKNLNLNTVSVAVLERHRLRVDATASESALYNILTLNSSRTSTIFESEHDYSHQSPETLSMEGDITSAEWSLNLPVQLPESFDLAAQSVSTRPIQIDHQLVIRAQFYNTETNASITVEENVPFSIYMTPAVIGDDGTIHGQNFECFQENEEIPPAYGHHRCDAIPAEWTDYLRQLSVDELQVSRPQQYYQQGLDTRSCIPICQGSLGHDPPAYQFCPT